jgi:hypothetical protein
MVTQQQKAEQFLELHHKGDTVKANIGAIRAALQP